MRIGIGDSTWQIDLPSGMEQLGTFHTLKLSGDELSVDGVVVATNNQWGARSAVMSPYLDTFVLGDTAKGRWLEQSLLNNLLSSSINISENVLKIIALTRT